MVVEAVEAAEAVEATFFLDDLRRVDDLLLVDGRPSLFLRLPPACQEWAEKDKENAVNILSFFVKE